MSDLRLAVRQLRKAPGFTAVALLTIALGIGACTAIFSLVDSALLRPLAYPRPGELVEFCWRSEAFGTYPLVSGPAFREWRDHARQFAGVALLRNEFPITLLGPEVPERVTGAEVTPDYLGVLGVKLALGQDFASSAGEVGGDDAVMILTHEWWTRRFGSDPSVIGRTIECANSSYRVVGVLPPRALATANVAFLVPLVLYDFPWRMDPASTWARAVGRLQPDATVATAASEIDALARRLYAREYPNFHFVGAEVRPLQAGLTVGLREPLILVFSAVGCVLSVVCANIANLLLARATARRKEIAVRLALGASGGRVLRQLLVESLVLSLAGGALGAFLALFAVDLLQAASASLLPEMLWPRIDLRVLGFSAAVATSVGLAFGLLPALQAARADLNAALLATGRGLTGSGRSALQSLLVIGEVAVTVVLLVGAGLLVRSALRARRAELNFDPRQTLTCQVSLSRRALPKDDQLTPQLDEFVRRVRQLPGVAAAAIATTAPMGPNNWAVRVGRPDQAAEDCLDATIDFVGTDYLPALGLRLLAGRTLGEADNRPGAPRVTLISDTLARRLFPGLEPLGREVRFRDENWQVVGVVPQVRAVSPDNPYFPHVYAPHSHMPTTVTLLVRTTSAPRALVRPLQQTLAGLGSGHALSDFRTLEEAVAQSLRGRHVTLGLIAAFASTALVLAVIGIYGVLAYTVRQRERELSIRLALGASPRSVVRSVLRDGLRLGAIGLVLGLVGAVAATRLLAGQLYEVGLLDPVTFAMATVVALLAVWAGSLLPARRTTGLDPIVALRAE
ncbi:MAG: ABC transporter permease [Opitutaceae bacterium]